MAWKVSADPDDREKVEKWFRNKVPVTQEEYDKLSDDAKERSFTIGGTTQLRVVQTILRELKRAATGGPIGFETFKEALKERLKSGYVDKNAPRLRAAFSITTQQAYSAGRYAELNDPEALERRPYLVFDAVLDSRTSRLCRRLNGTTLRADDRWWQTHWPPCHIGCRSSVRALTVRAARKNGVTRFRPSLAPDEGFGISPNNRPVWEPDAEDFDAEAFATFKTKLAGMRAARKVAGRIIRKGK